MKAIENKSEAKEMKAEKKIDKAKGKEMKAKEMKAEKKIDKAKGKAKGKEMKAKEMKAEKKIDKAKGKAKGKVVRKMTGKNLERSAKAQDRRMIKTHRGVLNITAGGKLDGKGQHRYVGQRTEKNQFGHCTGTIGAKIDDLLLKGHYTRKELARLAGTRLSKVNSHIAHLRRDKGVPVSSIRGGEVWIDLND